MILGKIPTEDALMRGGFCLASMCRLGWKHVETLEHLFVGCPYSRFLWLSLATIFTCLVNLSSFSKLINGAFKMKMSKQIFLYGQWR